MNTFFYSDSLGQRWGVIQQPSERSCGPTAVEMTEVYYKSAVAASLDREVRRRSQAYSDAFSEGRGMGMQNMVEVLRDRGVRTYDVAQVDPHRVINYLYQYVNDRTPAIVEIQHPLGLHVIVCVFVYRDDRKYIFLDPAPRVGLVELRGRQLPAYPLTSTNLSVRPEYWPANLTGKIIITRQ